MNNINREIVLEIYRTFALFGAEFDLLGTIGSWGDCLPEEDVLADLKNYNKVMLDEIKGRIELYESSFPPSVYTHDEAQKMTQKV